MDRGTRSTPLTANICTVDANWQCLVPLHAYLRICTHPLEDDDDGSDADSDDGDGDDDDGDDNDADDEDAAAAEEIPQQPNPNKEMDDFVSRGQVS